MKQCKRKTERVKRVHKSSLQKKLNEMDEENKSEGD